MHLYADSMISLNWIKSKVVNFDKIERKATIINNKLDCIVENCKKFPVVFHHIEGNNNPADFVTRCVSAKIMSNKN